MKPPRGNQPRRLVAGRSAVNRYAISSMRIAGGARCLNDRMSSSGCPSTTTGWLSVEFGASFESLRLAYLLLSVMVTLALLGAAYVAWDADEWSSAAGWTLVAFIGVGLVYVSVVRGDLMSERAQSAAAIEEQPLADLHEAERYVAAKLSDPVNARG